LVNVNRLFQKRLARHEKMQVLSQNGAPLYSGDQT
jgi:hypothetical protein